MVVPTERFDAVVAGLGAMGGACAAHLARRGLDVLGLDGLRPPHTRGSSHGSTRIIREGYFEGELYVPLVRRAYELWHELEREEQRELLTVTGALLVGPAASPVLGRTLDSLRNHGVAHEVLDPAAAVDRFPHVVHRPDGRTIYEPGAGVLRVEACVEAHHRSAGRFGAELRFDEPVLRWSTGRVGVVVETERARYEADTLILALGPWLPQRVPGLPLTVERQVQVWFNPRDEDLMRFAHPVFLLHTDSNALMYGIPSDPRGFKAALHHGGEIGTIDSLSREVTPADVKAVRDELERHLPAAAGEVVGASVCFYTNARDDHFVIDRHPDNERVWLVSACSGHGFKFSPVIGERVAAWVADGQPPEGIADFGVERLWQPF